MVRWHQQFSGHEFEQTGRQWGTEEPGFATLRLQRVGWDLGTEQPPPQNNENCHLDHFSGLKYIQSVQCSHYLYNVQKVKVTQLCPALCDLMDYTVRGILQARILEWIAFPFSRRSSQSRGQTQVSGIAVRFFTS